MNDRQHDLRSRRVAEDLHLEALDDLEVAQFADCALASLHARLGDSETPELAAAIEVACDAWDRVADLLPEFRAPSDSDGADANGGFR